MQRASGRKSCYTMSEEIKLEAAESGVRSMEPSASAAGAPSDSKPKHLSVYSHIDGIQEVGQLRGLRSTRRRRRGTRPPADAEAVKYAQALPDLDLGFTEDMVLEMRAKLMSAFDEFISSVTNRLTTLLSHIEEREGRLPDTHASVLV